MNQPISWQQAVVEAQKRINERCRAEGIAPLSGHDIAILAAHHTGERVYDCARALHADHPEFNEQAVQYAAKLIAQAILGGKS